MNLLEDFFKFLKTHRLSLDTGNPTLLAVSGGLDSVVMAHLFQAAKLPFAIAHCNFQLRDAASDADELFVQKVALDFDAPFFVKRFETKTYAETNGLSIQMAARQLRYAWFQEIVAENDFGYIAVAQHLNDSVETALLNFVRGTGLAGLTGIKPAPSTAEQGVIRPLLFASRNEILEYARIHEITWYEDSSNASDDYARNFVRHHVVPRLEELNPNFLYTAARNMSRIEAAAHNLTFLLDKWLDIDRQTINSATIALEKQKLKQLPSPEQALRHWLKPFGFDAEQARQLAENLDHVGFELSSEKGWQLLNDRAEILLRHSERGDSSGEIFDHPLSIVIQEDDLMVSLPDDSRLFLMHATVSDMSIHQLPITNHQFTTVDAEKLKFPLHLRRWLPGDSFQPFGMGGKSQKLQDFFTNQKLTRFEKEEVWLLVNGDGAIIWLLGRRLDERFKIHSNTNKALKINWII